MISANDSYAEKIIDELCKTRCLTRIGKASAMKDLSELSVDDLNAAEDEAEDDNGFVFTYVGVIVAGTVVFMCYPKYYRDEKPDGKQMKRIFEVIGRYNSDKKQDIRHLSGDQPDGSSNLLSIILFLLKDYYDYGIFNKEEEIVEINGDGSILWDKTVNESVPLFSGGRPYYTEIYDRRELNNEEELITRLHRVILDECSDYLIKLGLLDLLSMEELHLSDETRELLGDDDALSEMILEELKLQFNTRNQILLRTMYDYILHTHAERMEENVSFYGTSAFYDVWEKVCAEVLNDCLHKRISDLPYGSLPYDRSYNEKKLIELIEKPVWREHTENGTGLEAGDTLIPDMISMEIADGQRYFVISDAKYYTIELDESRGILSGQPGIESITKQYLYQLAYRDFLRFNRVEHIGNCFLMPSKEEHIVCKGFVSLSMFHQISVNPALVPIQVCLLPADKMFDLYLGRKHISVRELGLH